VKLEDRVFAALKRKPKLSDVEIAQELHVTLQELRPVLKALVQRGYLQRNGFRYWIDIVLNPIERSNRKDFVFEALLTGEEPSDGFLHPHYCCLPPADQGNVGSCGGWGAKIWGDLNYGDLTGDWPTFEELQAVKRDVVDENGVRRDILPPTALSAMCPYVISRKIGNVIYPQGTYAWAVPRALYEFGNVPEAMWPTGKEPSPNYEMIPPGASAVAEGHRIEGYARIMSFDGVRIALDQRRKVMGGIPVYYNYRDMIGGDGGFPEPPEVHPEDQIAGGHFMAWIGHQKHPTDPRKDRLICAHSWYPKVPATGYITRNYWDVACRTPELVEFYAALDSEEVKILRDMFGKVVVRSNVPAKVYVDGEYVGDAAPEIKMALVRGTVYRITARAKCQSGEITQEVTGGDTVVEFTFEEEPGGQGSWWQHLWEAFVNWLRNLVRR